jgi:hypothetical protein
MAYSSSKTNLGRYNSSIKTVKRGADKMSDTLVKEIEIKLRDIDQLYKAPDQDIFSELEVEMFGESGMERVQKKLQPGFWNKSGVLRLVLLLPKEKIKPGFNEKVMRAIDRFVELSTEDNKIAARTERWKGFRSLLMSLAVSLGLVVLAAILANLIPAKIPSEVSYFFYAILSLIIWVIIWNPLDTLVFEWIPFARANQILAYMAKAEIVIKPWE